MALGLQSAGSVVVAHWLSFSRACGIFLDQGSKLCPLHCQGSPKIYFKYCIFFKKPNAFLEHSKAELDLGALQKIAGRSDPSRTFPGQEPQVISQSRGQTPPDSHTCNPFPCLQNSLLLPKGQRGESGQEIRIQARDTFFEINHVGTLLTL